MADAPLAPEEVLRRILTRLQGNESIGIAIGDDSRPDLIVVGGTFASDVRAIMIEQLGRMLNDGGSDERP